MTLPVSGIYKITNLLNGKVYVGQSQNVFELKAGTLYPLLHGMEEKGLLTVYEQENLGKTRKYYSITKDGKELLQQKTSEWKEYQTAVTNVLAMGVL